jgi:membrane dipeptidase
MYIDLHCDTITTLNHKKASLYENDLMVSLKKGKALDKWLQTYAIFIPDQFRGQAAVDYYEDNLRYFHQQMEENKEHVLQINRFSDIDKAFSTGRSGGILAIEGGAAIGGDLKKIEKIAKDGVKFLTLTWNGKNEIASGNVTEEGMSDFGRDAIAEMERCGITVDVSHLNDHSFEDYLKVAKKPFIATHSNARAMCGHKRNLTDEQFKEIVRRGGIVGINFYIAFLNDDEKKADFPDLLRHIEHMLKLGGEDVIAMGSDFDGCTTHPGMNSVEKLADIREYLVREGIPQTMVEKFMGGNAYNFLRRTLEP